MKLLFKFFKKIEWFLFILLIIASLVQAFIISDLANRISEIIQYTSSNDFESYKKEIFMSIFFMILWIFILIFLFLMNAFLANYISSKIIHYIRTRIFLKVNKISLAKIEKIGINNIISRTTAELEWLQQNFIGFLSLFITAPATILFSFFTIAFQNPSSKNILHPDDKHIDSTPFILSGLAIIGFFLLLILVLVPIILPKVKKMQKSFEILNSNAIEITTGLKTILSFDAFLFHKNKIFDNCKTLKKSNVYLSGINLIYPALNLFSFIFSISIYLIGGILWNNNHQNSNITYETLVSYSYIAGIIFSSLQGLILLCIYIPTLFFFSKRINEILKAKIDIIDGIVINYEKLGITQKIKGKIEFKNVSFKFLDSAVFCLKNINLTINPGETIGIIGPTGSGKTTLVNLIPRFFDPDEGEILINDINIKDYQINDLRNKIGYVMQRSNLLNRSIEKNIGLNYNILNSEVTFEQLNAIKNSAKISQAEKFIELLPEKYKTIISQNATNISGGQKQRLAIATAINKPHEILIFDDSFSALDYSTDVKLRKQLEKNFKDSTKIFISSRINTVIKADRIVYIENGVIKGIGNHKELFLKNIQYKQIVLNQISEMEALYEK